jgi:hypothetical protein
LVVQASWATLEEGVVLHRHHEQKVQAMAQEKTKGEAAPTAPPGEPTTAKNKITKTEAVRRSLQKLGPDATPTEVQKDVKKRFGIDMTTDHISTTKSQLRKEASKNKPAQKQEETKPVAAPPAKAASNGKGTAVEMQDVLTLKDLVRRVGAAHLKTLIDVMSR